MAKKKKRRAPLRPVPKKVPKSVAQARQEAAIKKVAIVFMSFVVIGVVGLILFLLGALLLESIKEQPVAPPVAQEVNEVSIAVPEDPASEEELAKFWDAVVVPILQPMVWEMNHPIPMINDRITQIKKVAEARAGREIKFNVVLGYDAVTPGAFLTSGTTADGQPVVNFFVARIKEKHERFNKPGAIGGMAFVNELVIGFEHEVEHLAYSPTGITTYEEFLVEEALAHHNTCQHVIDPILERDGLISTGMAELHEAWVKFGKKPDSSGWLQFIRKRYPQEFVGRN